MYSDVAPSLFSEDIEPSSDDKDPASEDVSEVWVTTSPEINSFVTVSLQSFILPPWYSSASKNTSEPLTPELYDNDELNTWK